MSEKSTSGGLFALPLTFVVPGSPLAALPIHSRVHPMAQSLLPNRPLTLLLDDFLPSKRGRRFARSRRFPPPRESHPGKTRDRLAAAQPSRDRVRTCVVFVRRGRVRPLATDRLRRLPRPPLLVQRVLCSLRATRGGWVIDCCAVLSGRGDIPLP